VIAELLDRRPAGPGHAAGQRRGRRAGPDEAGSEKSECDRAPHELRTVAEREGRD
jgi:hypothetical protein